MKKNLNKAIIVLVASFCIIISCSKNIKKPDWVLNYPEKGVVGKCGQSPIPGKQKEMAIAQALSILATEKTGATVDMQQQLVKQVNNDKIRAQMVSKHTITLNGVKVKGKIVDEWKDPVTHFYYVWMVQE